MTSNTWIDVREQLPEPNTEVRVWAKLLHSPPSEPGYQTDARYRWHGEAHDWVATWDLTPLDNVTHWMPLPPAPTVE